MITEFHVYVFFSILCLSVCLLCVLKCLNSLFIHAVANISDDSIRFNCIDWVLLKSISTFLPYLILVTFQSNAFLTEKRISSDCNKCFVKVQKGAKNVYGCGSNDQTKYELFCGFKLFVGYLPDSIWVNIVSIEQNSFLFFAFFVVCEIGKFSVKYSSGFEPIQNFKRRNTIKSFKQIAIHLIHNWNEQKFKATQNICIVIMRDSNNSNFIYTFVSIFLLFSANFTRMLGLAPTRICTWV